MFNEKTGNPIVDNKARALNRRIWRTAVTRNPVRGAGRHARRDANWNRAAFADAAADIAQKIMEGTR